MVSLADVIWDMASNMWTFAELGSHELAPAMPEKALEILGILMEDLAKARSLR